MPSPDVVGSALMSSEYPIVSVIIPAFNRNQTLSRALLSVAQQTFREFEIIIVDDGSAQPADEVVAAFDDPRVRLLVHSKNRGANVARNTGIGAARGKYIAFLDSDDEWEKEKLEVQVNGIEQAPMSVGAHYTGYTVFFEDGGIGLKKTPVVAGNLLPFLVRSNVIGTLSTLLVKRSVLKAVGGFDETLPAAQDWDLYIRIAKLCEFTTVGDPLVRYYLGKDSISRNMKAKGRGLQLVLEKHNLEMSREPRAFARLLTKAGHYYCCAGSCSEGRQMLLRAIRCHPFVLRAYLFMCVSLLGGRFYERAVSFRKKAAPFV